MCWKVAVRGICCRNGENCWQMPLRAAPFSPEGNGPSWKSLGSAGLSPPVPLPPETGSAFVRRTRESPAGQGLPCDLVCDRKVENVFGVTAPPLWFPDPLDDTSGAEGTSRPSSEDRGVRCRLPGSWGLLRDPSGGSSGHWCDPGACPCEGPVWVRFPGETSCSRAGEF